MSPYLILFSSIALGTTGQVLMKWGTMQQSFSTTGSISVRLLQIAMNLPILFGLGCYAVSAILWIFALGSLPLSHAYPMVATGYVIVILCSIFLFHEPVTWSKAGGLTLIVLGVLAIGKA